MSESVGRIRFGPYEADRVSGELWKGRIRLKLQDLPFRLLLILMDRPREVVTREELRRRLWGDSVHVDFEHGLNNAVSKLRAVLRDRASRPSYVETVGRRGYRFLAQPAEAASRTAPTLGVMSFTAEVLETNGRYMGEMLADAISAALARMDGLRVVARSTVRRYGASSTSLARARAGAGATALIAGDVRQIGHLLLIYVELVDAASGVLRWSRRFTVAAGDLAGLVTRIAHEVAAVARPVFISVAPAASSDPEAWY